MQEQQFLLILVPGRPNKRLADRAGMVDDGNAAPRVESRCARMISTPLLFKFLSAVAEFFPGSLPFLRRHLLPFLSVLLKPGTFRRRHVEKALDAIMDEFSFVGRHLGKRAMETHQSGFPFDRHLAPGRVKALLKPRPLLFRHRQFFSWLPHEAIHSTNSGHCKCITVTLH